MKTVQEKPTFETHDIPGTNLKAITMQQKKTFKVTSKEIRKLGFDLGYGVTTGVFSAMFMVHLTLGMLKAIKRHTEKKLDAENEKNKSEKPKSEETVDT